MSRFDYVKYDDKATKDQAAFKQKFIELEQLVEQTFPEAGRAKSLVLTHLEDAYVWIGKAIRDQQLFQRGPAPLQEERTAS